MADDAETDDQLPKYKRKDFMEKEMGLYGAARLAARTTQRYGNNDADIEPIGDVQAIRPVHPVTDRVDPDDLNDI